MPSMANAAAVVSKSTPLSRSKKIWIDLDNSPHVPFFRPILEELRNKGHEVFVTARDAYQVPELLKYYGVSAQLIGRHHGKHKFLKALGTCTRAVALAISVRKFRPDISVCHGSRGCLLASALLGIPNVTLIDYEFTQKIPAIRPTWLIVPSVLVSDGLTVAGSKVLEYPGIKEDVYLQGFQPDQSLRQRLGISSDALLVTIRPPATEAHYHNPESETLFNEAVQRFLDTADARIVLLPRNKRQEAQLRSAWPKAIATGKVVIPDQVEDGLNLIWNSDLVVSGGGTMNREAAAMGVPVYSIFRGKIGAVDRYLAEQGRLSLVQSVEEVQTKIKAIRREKSAKSLATDFPALAAIVQNLENILGGNHSPARFLQNLRSTAGSIGIRMAGKTFSIGLLADFNVQNLAVLLQKGSTAPSCTCAPFGQTVNLLLNPKAGFWSSPYDGVVLWTAPEQAVPSFNKVVASEHSSPEDLVKDVDAFAGLLQHIPDTVQTILLPSWMRMQPGWEPSDLRNRVGVANALMRMNLRLAELLEHDRRIIVLDSHRWINAVGATAYDPRLWYLSKTPFHTKVFEEASRDILAVLEGIHGKSKKVVILDLDNTLWGGVVGEVGWSKLRLGGHDPVGEAFVDFQKALKRLSHRGIILALVSKNEESVALEAIERHPEMVLKVNDFAGWKINWLDKAGNIVQLMAQLNLGLESAVFLDDSAFERARVREALPQVLVPDLPPDPMRYPLFMTGLRCFENPFVSLEDRNRTKMYVADRGRTELRKDVSSLQEWLAMLELEVKVELLNHNNLERAAQLFNKTNQMNLSTRRLSAAELLSWSREDGHVLWTFRVRDKFGDYGLCGISSLVRNGASGQIVDFLLSCRVMGRGVEEAMLATVLQSAKALGCDTVYAQFISTPRNEPCRNWLEDLPAVKINAGKVMFSSIEAIPAPTHVSMSFSETDDEVLVQTRQ